LWIIWPMRNLGRFIVQMSTGLVSFGRVVEVIRQDREPLDEGRVQPAGSLDGAVEFRDVAFGYEGDERVLHGISFRAEPGQAVALLGPTGSGKTTLVNLLPRFYEYTSGSLTLDGHELKDLPRHYLRQQIGIVEQEPFLFSRSVRENITYGVGRPVSDDEVEAAARAAAIHDTILTFPEGYGTLVGEKGVTLSGGQKQRVAIARTLLKDPCILILDDSTSSVDTETEAEIREALERLMRGRTTFIIAHRIQSVMNADLILVLEHGRIVQRGRHEALMDQEGIYRRIYDMQARIEVELEQELAGAEPREPAVEGFVA
ncbi:MAG TPA: ABC transporter ATP-binding protein, partial [Anaerolineae bacterium]|nr:ABC transporter ATP-binding protein [Anaerolineae bacterium]